MDQGPDAEGVRRLLAEVTNALYLKEVRFLHKPLQFFEELGIAVDEIADVHKFVKECRAAKWARNNQTTPGRYNLFMDNSKQTLSYAVYRWGTPLALPYVLERQNDVDGREECEPLLSYVKEHRSAECFSDKLKSHERYGLGKAIGNKACHLYVKWLLYTFRLLPELDSSRWGPLSFEIPFDSNAGRVLFRTGFLTLWIDFATMKQWQVIQPGKGKGGLNYIRVTNLRGKTIDVPGEVLSAYRSVSAECLGKRTNSASKVQIQRLPHALLFLSRSTDKGGVGAVDDGLMHVGTQFCFNHSDPNCRECPVSSLCEAHNSKQNLITQYRT